MLTLLKNTLILFCLFSQALEKIKVKDSYNTVPPRHGKDGKKKRKGSSSEKPGSVEDLFAPPESLKTLYVQILRTKSLSESARPASIKKRKQETQPREYAEIPEKIEGTFEIALFHMSFWMISEKLRHL